MADRLAGGITVETMGYSTDIVLRAVTDNTEVTDKLAADLTATYWRQGGTPVAIELSDLAAIDSAWAAGGVKEADATAMPGTYRLDLPDGALAAGADWVEVNVFCSGSFVFKERFALTAYTLSDVIQLSTLSHIKRAQALEAFPFQMTDATTHAPLPGLTGITVTRSIDGAAHAAGTLANITEHPDADGTYLVDFGAGDLDGKVILLKAVKAGADTTLERIITVP